VSESDWRETLRERGYRLTPQRELILGAVVFVIAQVMQLGRELEEERSQFV